MGTSQQRHGATPATASDAEPRRLTAAEIAQIKRSNRDQRKREGCPPTTARDDALSTLAIFARNELVRQPEVRRRLAYVAEVRRLVFGPRENWPSRSARFDYWQGLGNLSRDLEGMIRQAELDDLARRWDEVEWRIDDDWPVLALGVTGGRPGRDTTMEPASVMLAVRSIALRPDARAKLNAERDKGYRSTRQRGHEHVQGARDHGAICADELAAAEANAREGRQGRYAIKRETVTKHRERLGALLGELGV